MESKKYKYSTIQNLLDLLEILAAFSAIIYGIITKGFNSEYLIGIAILIIGGLAIYTCRNFLFPWLRGKTVLQLDKEKLEYLNANKVIYWKDINSINSLEDSWGRLRITFLMKEGVKKIKISTKYIIGHDKDIYDTITAFFQKYKTIE